MRFHILLFYYDRPHMVRSALQSIREQTHKDWIISFIDDSSAHPGRPIAEDEMRDHLEQIQFIHTNDTTEQKLQRKGSMFGKFANDAMASRESDVSIMVCDDDALYPNYLENLERFYTEHPTIRYAYCNVTVFEPPREDWRNVKQEITRVFINQWGNIQPEGNLDSSQVSWRTRPTIESRIGFPYPLTANLDAKLFGQLYKSFGPCHSIKRLGVFKAMHRDRLGERSLDAWYNIKNQ